MSNETAPPAAETADAARFNHGLGLMFPAAAVRAVPVRARAERIAVRQIPRGEHRRRRQYHAHHQAPQ